MLGLMQAFVEQVGHMGVKGLAEAVHPAAGKAVDLFAGVWKRWQRIRQRQQMRDEIEALAQSTAAQVADEVREQLQDSFPDNPALRSEVEIYLSLVPAALRASLKRPADPTGRSVPADFLLRNESDFVQLFPAAVPQFRPGDPLPGVDSWILTELLGAGGFGEVWLVTSEVDDARRAVKFCTDPASRRKLIDHERAQVIRAMRAGVHPHLVPLHQFNLTGEKPWLMYEYVGGGTLADAVLEWQTLTAEARLANAVACLLQLTAAVAHLHRLTPPLVHRDLKPANVLRCDVTGRFRVTDLGLGGSAAEYELSLESHGGRSIAGRLPSMLGGSHTPLYASPEQRKGHPPDPRDDVHALGVIAYQLLTGRLDAAPGVELTDDLTDAGAPLLLIELIRKCVSSRAEKRPKDAGELLSFLSPPPLAGGGLGGRGDESSLVPLSPGREGLGVRGNGVREAGVELQSQSQQQQGLFPAPHMIRSPSDVMPHADLRVRGKWWWRPLDNTKATWKADVNTPAKVDLDPAREYRLEVASSTTDADLAGLAVLSGVETFRRLDLSGCVRLTRVGWPQLHRVPQLRHLNCYGCKELDDAALGLLLPLVGLRRLDLMCCKRITDRGLINVSGLPALEHLDLSGCEWVTDAGLVHLAKLPALTHVGLRNTQVTDAGAARLLRALAGLTVDR